MRLSNRTPHPIKIVRKDGITIMLKPEGVPPRVDDKPTVVGELAGIEVSCLNVGVTQFLPPMKDGTYYIVSRLVMESNPDREDLLCPGAAIRDREGNIIAVRGLYANIILRAIAVCCHGCKQSILDPDSIVWARADGHVCELPVNVYAWHEGCLGSEPYGVGCQQEMHGRRCNKA